VPYALEAALLSDALACTPPPSQQTAAAVPFFTALGPANEIHDASGLSMGGGPEDIWLKAGDRFESAIESSVHQGLT
jgi:hypothetical protein